MRLVDQVAEMGAKQDIYSYQAEERLRSSLKFANERPSAFKKHTENWTHFQIQRSKPHCRPGSNQSLEMTARHLRRISASFGALLTCAILLSAASLSSAEQPSPQLPTVIVRGFLNYRTTVDGTVLLFTPDAGQQQPASAVQPKATSQAVIEQTAAHPPKNLVQTETLVQPIEPTSVMSTSMHTATDLFQTAAHLAPSSPRQGQSAADAQAAAQPDEWRPVQMTPPLKMANLAPVSSSQPNQETAAPKSDSSEQTPARSRDEATSGRPRRPSFGNQGLKPRVPGTAGALSPSLQGRSRSTDGAPSPNSINGIRRPGLASGPAAQLPASSQVPTDPAVLANVSSAFQNRLANANTRLKNRFKHRQPVGPPAPQTAPSSTGQAQAQPKEHNSLVAPESLLDVASSIEQPTAAARSSALAPQSSRGGASELSSSAPVVGSDEVVATVPTSGSSPQQVASSLQDQDLVVPVVASSPETEAALEPMTPEQRAGVASLSRAGEQRPNDGSDGQPKVVSGQLQQGSLSSGPLNLDALFMSDQPSSSQAELQTPSEPAPSHAARPGLPKHPKSHNSTSLNGKLNGWLGQHHNKFVPRPSAKPHEESNLSQQLAANLQQLTPTPVPSSTPAGSVEGGANQTAEMSANLASGSEISASGNSSDAEPVSMQTVTRTYSTILETTRTRLVPMQVKSSTGILTVTEDYIMTKLMTAYQTIPANAEFILADQQLSTRAPYDIFEAPTTTSESKAKAEAQAPAAAAPAIAAGPVETQEQPISLDSSPKGANNWLHDFSNLDGSSLGPLTQDLSSALGQQDPNQQQAALMALLEQRARDANMAGFPLMSPSGEPLDQLASQLDPSSLLADGAINIPDLNNPLVLAAAIQNPQLAAVILAAQQLKLKRQQQQQQQKPLLQQQQPQQLMQLQPSYSTSFSTTVKPSTYTARDTMYTTRLVSFRDGRTVRTRTVSEPGSVVEQVLTTIVTETIPVTITIRPTGVLSGSPATALPSGGPNGFLGAQNNQATINNALFATQLANILARRQQQLQTSFNNPAFGNTAGLSQAASATPQQLLALQQFLNQQNQKRPNLAPQASQQQQQQFQPNFQQLLQSMSSPSSGASSSQALRQAASAPTAAQAAEPQHQATPSLQQVPKSVVSSATPVNLLGPLTTTLTSLQIRTYTVHNAFKTIFRTITSTVLIPTVLGAGATLLPGLG